MFLSLPFGVSAFFQTFTQVTQNFQWHAVDAVHLPFQWPWRTGKWSMFMMASFEQWSFHPAWLGYIGDEMLPSYIGMIRNEYIRIPINQQVYFTNQENPEIFGDFPSLATFCWPRSCEGRDLIWPVHLEDDETSFSQVEPVKNSWAKIPVNLSLRLEAGWWNSFLFTREFLYAEIWTMFQKVCKYITYVSTSICTKALSNIYTVDKTKWVDLNSFYLTRVFSLFHGKFQMQWQWFFWDIKKAMIPWAIFVTPSVQPQSLETMEKEWLTSMATGLLTFLHTWFAKICKLVTRFCHPECFAWFGWVTWNHKETLITQVSLVVSMSVRGNKFPPHPVS